VLGLPRLKVGDVKEEVGLPRDLGRLVDDDGRPAEPLSR
jgi:hypothetical protein